MKSARLPQIERARLRRGFTLIEVLAALLLMAIVIPVAMQAMSIASRAGTLGQRKTAAIRVADRMLNELLVTGQLNQSSSSGSIEDGDFTYDWTMQSEQWAEDPMTHVTVKVAFTIQGNTYEVAASTLYDATATTTTGSGLTGL